MKETTVMTLPSDRFEIRLVVVSSKFAVPMLMLENDVSATIHFDFQRGYAGRTDGPPENCYPGEPDQFEITKVILDEAAVLTDGEDNGLRWPLPAGTDLADYLSRNDIQWLEEQIAAVEA